MPNYRIVVLPSAEVDMQEIFDYIAQDNKQKALEIIDIFEEKIELLSRFPNSGHQKPYFIKRDIRMTIAAKHYQIIHYVKSDTVYILRVLTGYQDVFKLFSAL